MTVLILTTCPPTAITKLRCREKDLRGKVLGMDKPDKVPGMDRPDQLRNSPGILPWGLPRFSPRIVSRLWRGLVREPMDLCFWLRKKGSRASTKVSRTATASSSPWRSWRSSTSSATTKFKLCSEKEISSRWFANTRMLCSLSVPSKMKTTSISWWSTQGKGHWPV